MCGTVADSSDGVGVVLESNIACDRVWTRRTACTDRRKLAERRLTNPGTGRSVPIRDGAAVPASRAETADATARSAQSAVATSAIIKTWRVRLMRV